MDQETTDRIKHAETCDGDIETCELMGDWMGQAIMEPWSFDEYHDVDLHECGALCPTHGDPRDTNLAQPEVQS